MYQLRLLLIFSSVIVFTVCAALPLHAAPNTTHFSSGKHAPAMQYQVNVLTNSPTPLGTTTNFTVVSPEPGFTYEWLFPDGTRVRGTRVTYTFLTPGTFFVGFVPYYGDFEGGLYQVPITITASKTIYLPIVRR